MHLTEVGGALRQRSEFDPRLAVIFPKGQVAKSRRPRLSEFLSKEELKPFFRVVESRLRQSEKVPHTLLCLSCFVVVVVVVALGMASDGSKECINREACDSGKLNSKR